MTKGLDTMNSEATVVEQPKPKCHDPKLEAELESAYNEIQELEHTIFQIKENITLAKRERIILNQNLDHLWKVRKDLEHFLNKYRNLMKPIHQALCKIGGSNTVAKTCSAEEQLNEVIKILESRMTHESIHLSEEKQIVREIDKLRGLKSKCIACDARRAKIQDEIAYRDSLKPGDKEKLIGTETDIVSKELQLLKEQIRQDTIQKKYRANSVKISYAELKILGERNAKANMKIHELERKMNAPYMDSRQLSRDGRRRNPNQKSLVVRETTEMVLKLSLKQPKEVSTSSDTSSNEETAKLDKNIKEAIAKHKETKRRLQIATNKLAMLNKEEQAERRVAREAIRAERKAEEQQKNRDKRARRKARKKAAVNEVSSEGMEFDQQANAAMEQQVDPVKQVRAEGPSSIPKIILKTKKARKNQAWAARAAVFLAVVVFLIACCYLF